MENEIERKKKLKHILESVDFNFRRSLLPSLILQKFVSLK